MAVATFADQGMRVRAESPGRIIGGDPAPFREQFNHASFAFSHTLSTHPLFELPRLVELARRLSAAGTATFRAGETRVDDGWAEAPSRARSVEDAIARIEESDSWVLLRSVQEDPQYREILQQCLGELEALTAAPLKDEITWLDAYVFIASPRSITPYHIDHEANFLLQIRGEKDMSIFDPNDRSVLAEQEIERYYVGDLGAATYREEIQKKASVYRLTPGTGVHLPVRAPHWVRNGAGHSVSLSINFCLRSADRQARIYQVNSYLRRLGVTPAPPGTSRVRDAAKALAMGTVGASRKPRTKYELLRAGVMRLELPARLGRRAARLVKPGA
jgi:hypothetical protein